MSVLVNGRFGSIPATEYNSERVAAFGQKRPLKNTYLIPLVALSMDFEMVAEKIGCPIHCILEPFGEIPERMRRIGNQH